MKFVKFEPIKTCRLVLRQLVESDVECYYKRLSSSDDVARYMLWEAHRSVEKTYENIQKAMSRYGTERFYSWGIALACDNSIIGRIDLLRFDEEHNSCSFAYMIGKEFWGQGYGTEALKAVFDFAFEKMEIRCISADHLCDNVASGKVMKKAGMHYVKSYPSKYEKSGKLYDADEYVITFEDWIRKKYE